MPADEYASFGGGGALKLKGAKVKKKNKKKEKNSDLEKNLATGDSASSLEKRPQPTEEDAHRKREKRADEDQEEVDEDQEEVDEDVLPERHMTEAERRLAEAKQKKLKELSESGRPELLKTHKERVEQLNTYLSKLSEHHDMPKIGPG